MLISPLESIKKADLLSVNSPLDADSHTLLVCGCLLVAHRLLALQSWESGMTRDRCTLIG